MPSQPQENATRSRTRNWSSEVRRVDPNRLRDIRKTLEYEFGSGKTTRKFYGDPAKRGAYAED